MKHLYDDGGPSVLARLFALFAGKVCVSERRGGQERECVSVCVRERESA